MREKEREGREERGAVSMEVRKTIGWNKIKEKGSMKARGSGPGKLQSWTG